MHHLGLAKDGLLLPSAVTAQTLVSMPARVSNFTTAFGQRLRLMNDGWTLADKGRAASVQERALHRCQCGEYYRLLIHHHDEMLTYEHAGFMSHCQQGPYYRTLGTAFLHPDSLDETRLGLKVILHFYLLEYHSNSYIQLLAVLVETSEQNKICLLIRHKLSLGFACLQEFSNSSTKQFEDNLWFVPLSQKVAFYDEMQKFIRGDPVGSCAMP